VPQSLNAAQALVDSSVESLAEMPCELEGYRLWEQRQTYGGVEQRWILVESPHRRESDDWLKPLEKEKKGRGYNGSYDSCAARSLPVNPRPWRR
jgi:hypothetical protein